MPVLKTGFGQGTGNKPQILEIIAGVAEGIEGSRSYLCPCRGNDPEIEQ
jgi:hypothetical protein